METYRNDYIYQMAPDSTSQDDRSLTKIQRIVLFLMSTLYFGSSYVYDLPQALQTQLQSPPINLSYVEFNSLYSVYSFPNILLPLVGGYVIKLIGLRRGVLLYTFLVLSGQALLTVGVLRGSYICMLCGRMLYALGAESLSVAQSMIAMKWFSSHQLTYVLGWNNSVASLASNLNILFSPMIYAGSGALWMPCFVGILFGVFSFVSALGYQKLDEKHDQPHGEAAPQTEHKVKCSDLKEVSNIFLVLCAYYAIFYISFDGVTTNINDQIHQRFGFSNSTSGQLVLIYYLQLVLLPPVVGKISDVYGKRVHWLIGSAVISIFAQLLLGFLPDAAENGYSVVLPLLLLGFADNIFETVTWSCLLLALDPELSGIGFGFATSVMNLFNVFGMLAIGRIQDDTVAVKYGYFYSQIFLAGVSIVSMMLAYTILRLDQRGNGKLSAPLEENKEENSDEIDAESKKRIELQTFIPVTA